MSKKRRKRYQSFRMITLQHNSRIRILRILRIVKKSRNLSNFKTANEFYYFILYTFLTFDT